MSHRPTRTTWRAGLLAIVSTVAAVLAMLTPTTNASAHLDNSLAPNGVSPFLYSQPFVMTTWYNEGLHVDWLNGVHYNDTYALDLVATGGACGKVLYPIYNGLGVYSVDRTTGTLDMRGTVGGAYHRLRYLHMDTIYVNPGQGVGTNTVVGTVGTRGNSTGCHVHISVHRLASDGWFYSRRPMICGREIPHDHSATFASC